MCGRGTQGTLPRLGGKTEASAEVYVRAGDETIANERDLARWNAEELGRKSRARWFTSCNKPPEEVCARRGSFVESDATSTLQPRDATSSPNVFSRHQDDRWGQRQDRRAPLFT